jgi:murein DD-endopeptidase MepM/ murein hydrolase activator NlpD
MGLILVKKFQLKFLAGLMIVGLSLGGFDQLPVLANRPVEAATQTESLILDEPTSLTTHTESTAQLPLKEDQFRLTQGFSLFHPAVDLAASLGTPIKPIAAGQVVIISSNSFGLGNYLVIKHGADFYSVYAHLNEFLVEKDQEVTKDTLIGAVGNTGFSTGPHLHLEVINDNQKINPLTILPDF